LLRDQLLLWSGTAFKAEGPWTEYHKDTARLTALGIDYHVDPKLVRGLDYYCHLVFEFQTDALGAQNAICSGGRYDGLIQDLGGPQTAGVGWAAGIDRLAELSNLNVEPLARVALVPMGEAAEHACLALSQGLRKSGVAVEVGFSGNVQKRMKRADKLKCTWAIVIGDNELQSGRVAVKHLATGQVTEAGFDSLLNFFVDGDFN
jgi:histidyl-tRNA synthetase